MLKGMTVWTVLMTIGSCVPRAMTVSTEAERGRKYGCGNPSLRGLLNDITAWALVNSPLV